MSTPSKQRTRDWEDQRSGNKETATTTELTRSKSQRKKLSDGSPHERHVGVPGNSGDTGTQERLLTGDTNVDTRTEKTGVEITLYKTIHEEESTRPLKWLLKRYTSDSNVCINWIHYILRRKG